MRTTSSEAALGPWVKGKLLMLSAIILLGMYASTRREIVVRLNKVKVRKPGDVFLLVFHTSSLVCLRSFENCSFFNLYF